MGPRFIDRGNEVFERWKTGYLAGFMGPRFIDRGNKEKGWEEHWSLSASMGPRFIDRGNGRALHGQQQEARGFNGAAVH